VTDSNTVSCGVEANKSKQSYFQRRD